MKRRLFLLLGASTMSVTSLVGFTVASPTPAAALPNNNLLVGIGYIIQCLTPQHLVNDFAVCLVNAIQNLVKNLSLPTSLGTSALPTLPTRGGVGANAPSLNLPTNVRGILSTMPPALQTTPVASAPTVQAPIKNLIPTGSKGLSIGSLPKLPALTDIKFLNASDTKTSSSAPVSTSDAVALAGLGLFAASAVVARRRLASAVS